jgi:hypothetical protein
MRRLRPAWIVAAGLALGIFYVAGATEHAGSVNTFRGRGDQSGYLWDAVGIYQMRHGSEPALIGERNRMPVYPWLLSWLYDPAMSPDEFFEVGKRWNIRLSLVLLAGYALIASRTLPPLLAVNFLLTIAFGYYMFKAGYVQVELLFYFLNFVTFLACWGLVRARGTSAILGFAALGGVLMALSHLAKAAVLPFAGVVLLVCAGQALASAIAAWQGVPARRGEARRLFVARTAAALVFTACFLAVLYPYISNSKRVFGQWFYNVNSTFYVWYDDWPSASVGTYKDGDGVGWPTTPPDQIPTPRTYLRDHTAGQIANRFLTGFIEMFTVSYIRLWYAKAIGAVRCCSGCCSSSPNWRRVRRSHPAPACRVRVHGAVRSVAYTAAVCDPAVRSTRAREPRERARRHGARPPGRASAAVGGSAGAKPPGSEMVPDGLAPVLGSNGDAPTALRGHELADFIRRTYYSPLAGRPAPDAAPGVRLDGPSGSAATLPLPLPPAIWTDVVFGGRETPETLLGAILRSRGASLFYYGLLALDDETRAWLATEPR